MATARVGSRSRDLLIVMPTTKPWGKVEVGLGFGNCNVLWIFFRNQEFSALIIEN